MPLQMTHFPQTCGIYCGWDRPGGSGPNHTGTFLQRGFVYSWSAFRDRDTLWMIIIVIIILVDVLEQTWDEAAIKINPTPPRNWECVASWEQRWYLEDWKLKVNLVFVFPETIEEGRHWVLKIEPEYFGHSCDGADDFDEGRLMILSGCLFTCSFRSIGWYYSLII